MQSIESIMIVSWLMREWGSILLIYCMYSPSYFKDFSVSFSAKIAR